MHHDYHKEPPMARILVTDGMADDGIAQLSEAGHEVVVQSVSAEELPNLIGNFDGLVVRSATQVTADVLAAGAPRLRIVGRAGVGVDNIDTAAATAKGVVVINAPLGNILSAAEHTIGMIFASHRNIPQAHAKLNAGTWDKKSFIGHEVCGKTLGIIGLGKIGSHVAKVMQAAGMNVIAFDPFLSREVAEQLRVESLPLEEVLAQSDVITLHVPMTEKTKDMINLTSLKTMKPSARVVNVARGGIINEDDLATALNEGIIAGAALDVFAQEPLAEDSPLRGLPNCVITPHLGASTAEAQVKVSTDIAAGFNAFFADGTIVNAVNVQLRVDPAIDGYLAVAEKLGSALVQSIDQPLRGLEVRARGELAKYDIKPLGVAALKGALSHICEESVNLINASHIAQQRGIDLTTSASENLKNWSVRLALRATTRDGEHIIGGSLVNGELRIQRFDDYRIDLPVGGHLLVMEYQDRPGMVGSYGSILGDANINIARMEVGRIDGRGDALVILTLDDPVPAPVLDQLRSTIHPQRLFAISF
ncbi:MAG: phosphoglycerate dehydrogenase [Planctomycetota bacterium]|nr:MAG: phosphoglycerate dehydrogenase [Planctomycetota bacterium]